MSFLVSSLTLSANFLLLKINSLSVSESKYNGINFDKFFEFFQRFPADPIFQTQLDSEVVWCLPASIKYILYIIFYINYHLYLEL